MFERISILILALALVLVCRAQPIIPVIHSDSTIIDIRDGLNYIQKQWVLLPAIKPDIYQTPNTINTKLVSFITNKDSISFNVEPGKEYDLVIILREKDSCLIKISPFRGTSFLPTASPRAQSRGFALIICIATMITAVILAVPRKQTTIILLLAIGILAALGFWLCLTVAGIIHQNYNHITLTVSQLGAIGTRSEFFMAISTWLIGTAVFASATGLVRLCIQKKITPIPVLPLLLLAASFCLLSFFPLGHLQHGTVGGMGLVFMLSPILALFFWKKELGQYVRIISMISLFFCLLIFLRFIPAINDQFEGLVQRCFHLGWTFWLGAICYKFIYASRN